MMSMQRRGVVAPVAVALAFLASGCAPTAGADDWTLEPIPFSAQLTGEAETQLTKEVDVAFGMSNVASDGQGGFWAESAGSWLHVGGDGETLARFNIDVDQPLHPITSMTALSPTELVVTRQADQPELTVINTETMDFVDVPRMPIPEDETDFGDFEFGAVDVHDGDAYIVRYQPVPTAYMDFEILRINLDTGARTLLHREALSFDESPETAPALPPVDLDTDAAGQVYVATPSYRLVLAPDGAELSRAARSATRPIVAASPDGVALWWGGAEESASVESVIVGGSAEARDSISRRTECSELFRQDALRMTGGAAEQPLPFLCGANDATWIGDSWVVAIGGEGDGVLVRLTPPAGFG